MEGGIDKSRMDRIVQRAKAETAPPQRSSANEGADNDIPEFPEIAQMTAEQSEQQIKELEEKRDSITSWGDLTWEDRQLLSSIDKRLEAHRKNIALKRSGEGMRHAA
jgi:hypothetical protein